MTSNIARERFNTVFPRKNTVLWVVHCLDIEQTTRNVKIAIENWLHWVFLINHWDIWPIEFIHIIKKTRENFQKIWMWVNFLGWEMLETVATVWILEWVWTRIDWIWTDNPEIKWINKGLDNWDKIDTAMVDIWWDGLYFWWLEFKWQNTAPNLELACNQWMKYLDIITTSWPWTGMPADPEKIKKIRSLSWNHPLWLASWVDVENISGYSDYTDVYLVASSLSATLWNWKSDFHNFDPIKVRELGDIVEWLNK